MKNINLAPHSSLPEKRRDGNKPFIFISILTLMFLFFACLYLYISSHNQWQDYFGVKIGSFFNIEKPGKLIRLSDSKKNSEVKKHVEPHENEQEHVESFEIAEREKEESVLEKTFHQTIGIGAEVDEDSTDTIVAANETEKKTKSAKVEEKIVPVETEKGPALTKVESIKERAEREKPKQLESDLNKDSNYYVQVCSCVIKENADKIFSELIEHGYSPVMEEIVRDIKMNNIYTNDFTQKSDALEFLSRLKKDGFDSALLPSSGNGYKIRITSCFYMESAKGIIKRLNRLGYNTNIYKEFIPTRMYSVLLRDFESLEEAEAVSDRLIKLGYPKPILKRNPKT